MPFINLNETDVLINSEVYDITIIGAGAAGILLAVELTKKGKKVLLIETGHFNIDEEKQKLNEVVNTGKILENAVWGRKRAIGGTTLAWGGQSLPFSTMDFSKRDWVKNSGWPIPYKEISKYYNQANAFMKIDTLNYKEDIFKNIKLADPGIDASLFEYHISKWASEPNFQILYKKFLDDKVTIIYNAHLYKIHKNEESRITAIALYNFKEKLFTININTLIIAAGGIESVRILLDNQIGNHSGWLGKCFMDHPCIEVGEVITKDSYRLQKYFNTHVWQKRKYSVRLSLGKKQQQQKELLNCSASILFDPPEDKFNPYAEFISFRKDFKIRRLFKLSGSISSITKSLWVLFKDRFYYKVNAVNKLFLMIEQEPVEESFISLSEDLDKFGTPKARINWNITYKTWETVLAISKLLKQEIERLKFGTVDIYSVINDENKNWADCLSDVNHHMGASRMSSSAEKGVVNENLQVWGISNLYVCSSSVFPTSSHSNPTLTLLALGVRLSNFLSRK